MRRAGGSSTSTAQGKPSDTHLVSAGARQDNSPIPSAVGSSLAGLEQAQCCVLPFWDQLHMGPHAHLSPLKPHEMPCPSELVLPLHGDPPSLHCQQDRQQGCGWLRYLEEPLKAALLDSLAWQDVGELSVGVRDEEAGGHVFLDKLGDAGLRAGADRRVA